MTIVEVTDASGDDEVDADKDAFHDGMASLLLEGIDRGDAIESDDIEGEPDNDTSDEMEAEDEMLKDGKGLFEEETEEVGKKLSV